MSHDPTSLEAAQAALLAARGLDPHLMGPGPSDVHVDTALSNLAVKYNPNAGKLIADQVCPVIPVTVRSGKFFIYGEGTHLEINRANIASQSGHVAQINWSMTQDSFAVEDFGLKDFVPSDVEQVADAPLRPLADSTEIVMDRLALNREKRAADLIFNTSTYGSMYRTLAGAEQWSNPSSDPVAMIDAAKSNVNLKTDPNVCVMGKDVWDYLRRHPEIEKYILSRAATSLGSTPLRVTLDLFAQAFDFEKVLVGEAKYNSAAPGATSSLSRVWGKHLAIITLPRVVRLNEVTSTAYTLRFVRNGSPSYAVRKWFDAAPGVAGGTWVKVTYSETIKTVGGGATGYLFRNAVA